MRCLNKLAIIAIAAFLTLNTAAASTADLDIFPGSSSTKVDSFTSYEIQITNTGTVDDVYDISSSHPEEIRVAPVEVPEQGTLEPGESETVQVWFNPNLDREEGSYTFTINAESQASGETYTVQGDVRVIRDHDVNVDVESPGSVCRGEEAVYTVFISNSGTQAETFRLKADAGDFSQKKIRVESGETRSVELTRSSDIAVNDRSFNIRAKSTSSYAEDVTSTSFHVEQCYESSTTLNPSNQRTAALTQSSFEVRVSNDGTKSDTFTLSTNYGELDETELSIAAGDSKTTELTYTPERLENRNIQVTATGESTSSDSASLEVYNGQNVSVEFSDSSQKVCEAETFEKEVTLENTGAAADTYSVSTSRGDLSETEVELEPGETRRLEIDLNSSKYRTGSSYKVKIDVQSQTFSKPSKSATSSFTVEDCYNLKMDVVPNIQSAGENRSVLYEIHLENTGTEKNEYHLTGKGPEWISVRPQVVNVNSGDTEKSYVYAGIPYNKVNGTEEITVHASGKMVEREETVSLKVGEEVKESLRSAKGGRITGMFKDLSETLQGMGDVTKLAISLIAGLIISAVILRKEW